MRYVRFKLVLVFLLIFLSYKGFALEETVSIHFGPSLEIGREDFFFGTIDGVCEDEKGNFYVLDRAEHKVSKFSRDGKLLLKFGNRGEGPGDFREPNRISYTAEKNIVVCDDMYFISFFHTDGSFIKRIQLNGKLAPAYIGEDRFYGWVWLPEGQKQVVVDGKNEVIQTFHSIAKDSFSVSIPDSSGRQVMFNYSRYEFVPIFIFTHHQKFSALGISNEYNILILNNEGKIHSRIQRDINPDKFSKKERESLEEDIEAFAKKRGWPDRVARDLKKIIPDTKNYFHFVLLSKSHVFVFRIPSDITKEERSVPVDIFTLQGHFLGRTGLENSPIHISSSNMYFDRSEKDGNVYLVKRNYEIK